MGTDVIGDAGRAGDAGRPVRPVTGEIVFAIGAGAATAA